MVLMALLCELDTLLKSNPRQTYFKRKVFINLNSSLVTPTILFCSQRLNGADGQTALARSPGLWWNVGVQLQDDRNTLDPTIYHIVCLHILKR